MVARSSQIDGDLDGSCLPLIGDGHKGIPPLLEVEGVGQHPGQVDAAGLDQVEVVGDAVPAAAFDLLDAKSIRADPGDLLEVQGTPLPAA
jgi:hypothetical protein